MANDPNSPQQGLDQEAILRESGDLYRELLSEPPRQGWWGALAMAVVFHAILFVLVIPESEVVVEPPKKKRIVKIKQPKIPPPPKMKKPKEVKKIEKKKKKLPIPDPDPEEPEPIKEPEPPDEPDIDIDLDFDFEEVVGVASTGFVGAKVQKQVKPEFPQMAKTAGIREAKVKVLLTINEQGKVTDVRWLEGLPVYKDAVIKAVYQFVYEPATQDGMAVEYTTPQTFIFRLE